MVVVPVVAFAPVGRLRKRGGQVTTGRAKARGQAPRKGDRRTRGATGPRARNDHKEKEKRGKDMLEKKKTNTRTCDHTDTCA